MESQFVAKCPRCQTLLKLKWDYIGKQARCPRCEIPFVVPAPESPGKSPSPPQRPRSEKHPPPPIEPVRESPIPKAQFVQLPGKRSATKKSRPKMAKTPSNTGAVWLVVGGGILGLAVLAGLGFLAVTAVQNRLESVLTDAVASAAQIPDGSGTTSTLENVIAESIRNADPGEEVYLKAVTPILKSLVERDDAALYGQLSTHCLARVDPQQFVPGDGDQGTPDDKLLRDVTLEQFQEWMQKSRTHFGAPQGLEHAYVITIDPLVLSGKGDRIEAMISIGSMPGSIPAAIRKAAIRAQIRIPFGPEAAAEIASELNVPVETVLNGTAEGLDEFETAYFNAKLVLVDDGGTLKLGYFEFLPPSFLD
ncbi:hypothetical protein [Planctomicrobium piriforme]|uniref:Uncharacterized protein n=1 Tax=Planctomicrobium piriforme TaxID=1576369 RepID=A0A1I3D5P2_9PLAN|nr:hypothetical protein [Planctomicrobium piriforme]SFH81851.1 hypothetical protein SAMN05421753_10396 [Planctomicrobium piriforme]